MLSGLYGDLPEAKNTAAQTSTDAGGWATKPKFAPPNRKATAFGAPRSVLGAAKKTQKEADGRPPLDPSRRGGGSKLPGSAAPGSSGLLGSARSDEQFEDEYDPARPNEYEQVRQDKERLRAEAQDEADRQEELRLLQEADRLADAQGPMSAGDRQAALSLSGEEAFLRRARLGSGGGGGGGNAQEGKDTFAQRMMEKMGWKEGLGLGKAHQGITTPLEHQKTDKRSGIIRAAEQIARMAEDGIDLPPEKKGKGVSFQGTPSRVILLLNIVDPREVDDSLEDEIGQECSKYGQISQITIFEVTEPGYNPEEAVRIFIEFQRLESATKALIDLEGRFFGGRTVRAKFFPEDRFEKQDLAPRPGQPD